jgi:hypothetical protein
MGLSFDELFPGRFLKSGQFKGKDVTLTIKSVRTEKLPSDQGGEKVKGIVGFQETPLELVLNRTNGECLKSLFGADADPGWIGHRVTFFPAPFHDNMTGEDTTAIRVRGSPELAADKQIEIRLPRKKPIKWTLKKTGAKAAQSNGKTPSPMSEADKAAALAAEQEQDGLPAEPGAEG